MAVLRKPGSIVRRELPSDADLPPEQRTIIHFKVMTEQQYREIFKATGAMVDAGTGMFDLMRKRWGHAIDRVENLTFEDGSEFTLEKDVHGWLTPACLTALLPLQDQINELLNGLHRITEADRKNS